MPFMAIFLNTGIIKYDTTSHMKLLSSKVLISLVLTTFPLKGPNFAPLRIASLRQKTP